jgi:hypothetical protein
MIVLGLLLVVFVLIVGGLLCLAYSETAQDFPSVRRCAVIEARRHSGRTIQSEIYGIVDLQERRVR